MKHVAAHYDGEKVVLDEPISLPANTPVEVLLPDSLDERRRGVEHGDDMLSLLDEIRDGLLAGTISRSLLNRLTIATAKHRDGFADPKLSTILDEIDVRARVELAKLEQAEKAVS